MTDITVTLTETQVLEICHCLNLEGKRYSDMADAALEARPIMTPANSIKVWLDTSEKLLGFAQELISALEDDEDQPGLTHTFESFATGG